MANRRFIDFPIASTVGDNDIVLIWQDGLNKQTTKGTLIQGVPMSLEDLTDVDIAGLINGQILQYNSVTGKWENVDRTDIDLDELGDVTIVSPSNGQVLIYNSSTSKWENSSIIGGFVPYTGASQNVNLGEFGIYAGFVNLDTTPTNTPSTQGTIYWDDSRSTAALIMNGTLQHIGQDAFFYVKNSTGSSIPKGTSVRFDGTDGASGHLKIAPFLANGTYPSNYFMGVTAETISNGAFGQVMHFGELDGINTSSYTAGALLYASTTVAGGFQTTAPVAPNNIVLIAAAINSKNNGTILVRTTYGSNINTDEGVKITTPTTGQLLQLQAGGLWENKTKAQVLGGTSSQFVKGDASLDSTVYQPLLTNPVTGTGTTNFLPKFTGATTIGNSVISDTATEINIPKRIFLNSGGQNILFTPNLSGTVNRIEGSSGIPLQIVTAGSSLAFAAGGATTQATLFSSGNFVINSAVDNGAKFQVTGTATISSTLSALKGDFGSAFTSTNVLQAIAPSATNSDMFQVGMLGVSNGFTIKRISSVFNYAFVDGNVGIKTASPTSTLQVAGSFSAPHVTKSANYTLDATDYTVGFDCASNRTATLPDATTCQGRIYVIYQYNTGSGARSVTLDGNGSQTINGVTTYSLSPFCEYSSVMIQSNGANWIIISSNFTTDCL